MPIPRKGESRESYLRRCIPQVIQEGTAKNRDQAVAVCNSMWRQRKRRRMILDRLSNKLSENSAR